MLILTRRVGEEVVIGGEDDQGKHTLFTADGKPVVITAAMLAVKGNQVRVGINAPKEVPVHRQEIVERIKRERLARRGKGGQQ